MNEIIEASQPPAPLAVRTNASDPAPLATLYRKMAQVMADMSRIPKNGWNDHHKYAYAEASDVKDAVRVSMAQHGLCMFPHVLDSKQDGKTTRVELMFVIACSETGATVSIPWYGEAQDSQDKGFNKALTSAIKYFLIDTFLIGTGDEPDPDSGPNAKVSAPQVARADFWQAVATEQLDRERATKAATWADGQSDPAQAYRKALATLRADKAARLQDQTSYDYAELDAIAAENQDGPDVDPLQQQTA